LANFTALTLRHSVYAVRALSPVSNIEGASIDASAAGFTVRPLATAFIDKCHVVGEMSTVGTNGNGLLLHKGILD
jgi:hypothetical protein